LVFRSGILWNNNIRGGVIVDWEVLIVVTEIDFDDFGVLKVLVAIAVFGLNGVLWIIIQGVVEADAKNQNIVGDDIDEGTGGEE
jgi:hypothetical protein